jgi:hypothetical protein
MSVADLYQDMLRDANVAYTKAQRRAQAASERESQTYTQLVKYRASHTSLIAHLRMAADDLIKTKPIMSKRYLEVADSWEKYCAEPQKDLGEVASATSGGPAHEAGGSAVPEVTPELESPQGVPVPDPTTGIPALITYAGEWDDES